MWEELEKSKEKLNLSRLIIYKENNINMNAFTQMCTFMLDRSKVMFMHKEGWNNFQQIDF